MSFKIGFTAETEKNEHDISDIHMPQKTNPNTPKKSVVDVFFPNRHLTCSYFNDMFDLKRGDIVYVDGKLEGLRGRVVDINYTFKIKLSDYKRVIGVADTKITGELFMAGSHFISFEPTAMPFEKIITWFKAPVKEDEEFVSSTDDKIYNLNDLSDMKIDKDTADRGYDYYMENRVVYIEIKNGKVRAIVNGTKPYEVEFDYHNGEISNLVCSCYCTGACKHEFATLLQLRETLRIIEQEYGKNDDGDYLAIINKAVFIEYAVENKTNGSFMMK